MVVDQKDGSESAHESEIRSLLAQSHERVHEHGKQAGDFDQSAGVSNEGAKAHPAQFHATLDADHRQTKKFD